MISSNSIYQSLLTVFTPIGAAGFAEPQMRVLVMQNVARQDAKRNAANSLLSQSIDLPKARNIKLMSLLDFDLFTS